MRISSLYRWQRSVNVARALALTCLIGHTSAAWAQQNPGALDATFNPGTGAYGFEVFSLALQPDGKIVIAGDFNAFNGVGRFSLARLNADGSLDMTFAPEVRNSADNDGVGQVNTVALQSNGKLLIGGVYTSVDGTTRSGPVRLNTDGTLDTTYDTTNNVYYVNGLDYALAVQPDGKVLVGDADGIERTTAAGSADSGFRPSSGDGSYGTNLQSVFAIAVQSDGKILIGGAFTTYGNAPRPQLARLNADGTVDTSFVPVTGLNQYGVVTSVAVQANGKILFAGHGYNMTTGATPGVLGRLNANGSVDTTFQAGFSADGTVNAVVVAGDGKILVGGAFNTIRGAAHKGFARLSVDGSVDPTLTGGIDTATTLNDAVSAIAIQPNAKIVLGGSFSAVDGASRNEVARVLGSHVAFFNGESQLANRVFYLAFPSKNYFGYYSYLSDPDYIFHFDLGYEYVFDAADGKSGVSFYDFKSGGFFYTSPTFPFPYLYDFSLNSVVYYYPDPSADGHYNTNGVRYFYVFKTGKIISK